MTIRDVPILIIDDEPANVALLERTLRQAGYTKLISTTDPETVPDLFRAARPDLVLLDLHMPRVDGFELLSAIRDEDDAVPVLVLTADVTLEARRRALGSGALDLVLKPFDLAEVLLRVANLINTRTTHQSLTARIEQQEGDAHRARLETLDRLAVAAEMRDDETGAHVARVGLIVERLALQVGLAADEAALFGRAARLHDLGKIGVPDHVLMKPGSLTEAEWTLMRRHTTMGADILRGSDSPMLRAAAEVAATHHERWDGDGYPGNLAGEAIPLAGRITTVADAFDAMTSDRRYRAARSVDEALAEVAANAGRQFDPDIAAALPACVVPATAG